MRAGGALPLLPWGEARLERTGETTIRDISGEERHVVSVAIGGLDLTPVHAWTNDDGSWFGSVSPWLSAGIRPAEVLRMATLGAARDPAAPLLRTLGVEPPG